MPLIKRISCAATSFICASGTMGHRRRRYGTSCCPWLWSCPYIRKSAKVVHISRLGSYRFRYLNTHSTSPTSLCSTKHTHHLLGRNERHTGHERMFLRFACIQDASSLPCNTASASKMHMMLAFRRRPPTLDMVGSQDGPHFAVQTPLKKKH